MTTDASPCRVCLVRQYFFPGDVRVRKEVRALLDAGLDVDVICVAGDGQKLYEEEPHLRVHRIPVRHMRKSAAQYMYMYLAYVTRALIKVTQLHLKKPFDLVQVSTMPDILAFAALAPRLTGVPLLLDMHEAMPELFMSLYEQKANSPMVVALKIMERMATSFASALLTVNKTCERLYRERGAPQSKMVAVLNVPDDNFVQRQGPPPPPPPLHEPVRIMSHGSILKRYGYDDLLDATALCKRQGDPVHLHIAGSGEYEKTVLERIQELDIADVVTVHGYLQPDDIRALILDCDFCVVPLEKDVYTDVMLPNKLFEYVALGRPAISSNTTTIEEFFPPDEVAYYQSGDAEDLVRVIRELSQDQERRETMVRKAYERYAPYHWTTHKYAYVDIVMRLLARKRPGGCPRN